MAAEPTTNQPSPEEQRRQQEAQLRGAAIPGRSAAGPTGQRGDVGVPMESAMGGASDADSGAGNATGTPDAETALRAGDAITRGDVRQDREKVFPESKDRPRAADAGEHSEREI